MRRALPLVFLLLLLCSQSFASQLWQFSADGAVSAKPVIYQGAVIVASDNGNIYALEPGSGVKRWQTAVGKAPNEVFLFDNALVASATNGKVAKLGPNGSPLWTTDLNTTAYNVSYIYGAVAGQRYIFVAADNGLYELDGGGNVTAKLVAFNSSISGPLAAGPDYVVFAKGNELYRVGESGAVLWNISLGEGDFWLSRPVLDGNGIFIGSTDGYLHYFALSNGVLLWSVRTNGWVGGTPLLVADAVYFGSDDGKVYAVDPGGEVRWTAQTQLAIQTQPEPGDMGGKGVIFVGGSDKSIYAISTADGQIVWKGPSGGVVGDPLFYQDSVIFGAGDGRVYSFSTERACSITSPREADVVGLKELAAMGNYVSESGGATVFVNVNDGEWQQANTTDTGWVYYIDPKKSLNPALNSISCKIADAGGDETGPTYTTVVINHDPQIPLSELRVAVTPDIIEKKPFTVFVNDGDDGSPVERFTLSLRGNDYHGDRNYTLTIDVPGTYELTVKKMGFNDATVTITVNASGVNPVFLVAGGIAILVIIVYVVGIVRKRGARRR
jgi:outer membrane protein assembly factor BamB